MPYWPPDTPPQPPGQMPAASGPGPAPVPYAGGDPSPSSGAAMPAVSPGIGAAAAVLGGVSGNGVQHSPPAAPNLNPYEAGTASAIYVGGDTDAGGRDDVAATIAGAVAASMARQAEHQAETYGLGSTIGDLMTLPPSPLDPGVGALGATSPSGGFYDPPRDYGD